MLPLLHGHIGQVRAQLEVQLELLRLLQRLVSIPDALVAPPPLRTLLSVQHVLLSMQAIYHLDTITSTASRTATSAAVPAATPVAARGNGLTD